MRHWLIDEGNSHKIRSVLTMQGGRAIIHVAFGFVGEREWRCEGGRRACLLAATDKRVGYIQGWLLLICYLTYVLIAQSPSNSGAKAKGVDYCSFPNVWTISDHIPSPSPWPFHSHVMPYHIMPIPCPWPSPFTCHAITYHAHPMPFPIPIYMPCHAITYHAHHMTIPIPIHMPCHIIPCPCPFPCAH